MLSLSDFEIDRQVFEARFPTAYLLWDRSGKLWRMMADDFPDMRLITAVPTAVQFESANFYLIVESGLLRITAKDNVPFDEFARLTSRFFRLTVETLEIRVFDRLGLRTIWAKNYSDLPKAAAAFRELGLLTELNGESFGLKAPLMGYEAKTIWEDGRNGVTFSCRSEKRHFEPQLPWDVRSTFPLKPVDRYLLIIDTDQYTMSEVRIDQLDIVEWLGSSQRTLKRAFSKELFR